jgi:hypothetical protein
VPLLIHRETEFSRLGEGWGSAALGRKFEPSLLLVRNGLNTEQNKVEGDFRVTRIETISDGHIAEDRVRFVSGLKEARKLRSTELQRETYYLVI